MKRLALLLLLLNAALWFWGVAGYGSGKPGLASTGILPRVESLKSPDKKLSAPSSPAARRPCINLGWFNSTASAEAFANDVARAGLQGYTVFSRERELAPLHWVIIPPQPRPEALAQLEQLRKQGVDSYLVAEGENRNAISLGLFQSRKAALMVKNEKKHQNLNAVLANFPRNQISYALSFEVGPNSVEQQVHEVKSDYSDKLDFIEINACEGVATPEKSP